MPYPPRAAGGDGSNDCFEKTMAKTAGIVVFSGIAISILKTLNPFNKPIMEPPPPLVESTQSEKTLAQPAPPCCRSSQAPQRPRPETLFQIPVSSSSVEQSAVESEGKAAEIVKGDILWGLSTKYVSIQAIKEANGLKSDTIYAGKKLIIPPS